MTMESEIEIEARYSNIDIDGMNCDVACIATFVNGKCKDIVVTDLANLIDYVKRH